MKSILLPFVLSAAAGLQPALAASPDNPPVRIRVIPKAFALTNDQVITITHSRLARHYRVCVDAGQDAMAVRVTSDGINREIPSGDCWDFQARKIAITPAGRLEDDAELLGRYERLRH